MARHVMIIGNGDVENGAKGRIDAADIVIRFNDCRSAAASGGRTDIVAVCNTGRPGKKMTEDPTWRDIPAVAMASQIWCSRNPEIFAAMRPPLAASHPELDDFCDDYTAGYQAICAASGKHLHVFSAATHARLDRELEAFAPTPYVAPSTGLLVIAEFLWNFRQPNDEIALAGFGHQGWEWHPWNAERRFVDACVTQDLLTRFIDIPSRRYASGA
jgi:hypothetical protein